MYIHIWHHSKFTEDASRNGEKRCFCQNENFSGTSDTVRQVKALRIISNEILALLPILCQ